MENVNLIFKALSDPTRLEILKVLYSRDRICVVDLVNMFNIPQSKLSYHLKLLLSANLIHKVSEGRLNYYSVNTDVISNVLTYHIIQKIFF